MTRASQSVGTPPPSADLRRIMDFSDRWALVWGEDDAIVADLLTVIAQAVAAAGLRK